MKFGLCAICAAAGAGLLSAQSWSGYGHDSLHSGQSAYQSQSLSSLHWFTPMDLNPPGNGGSLFIHYGSPTVTSGNTVLLPVKTTAAGGFEIQAFKGSSTPLYTLPSDYTLPAHNWIPPYGPALGARSIYYPGAGGTVYNRLLPDFTVGPVTQLAFYGLPAYNADKATYNNTVAIDTPLTIDHFGNIYFGFVVTGTNQAGLTSGIARISSTGVGSWTPISSLGIGDGNIVQPATNAAPVLSVDQQKLYVVASSGAEFGYGYLVELNSATLAPIAHVELLDPFGNAGTVSSDSSSSPMVGPDGDVYFGVLETPCCTSHHDRGWMLHYNSALNQQKTTGSFGWDTTPSVVLSSLVPSYNGPSTYLIFTKYNNYAGVGGDGVNKVAILDPNATQSDEYSSGNVQVMREVITIAGVTADNKPGFPNAVREWCINTAAIDPFSKSAMVNSEDGWLYRWDFTTNSFTQKIKLTNGIGEAYTPTAIGADGTVYAINDATLFAVGNRE